MRQEVHCAECIRNSRPGPLCAWCGAPLTGPPFAAGPAGPKRGAEALIAVGTALAAFAALLLALNIVSGFDPRSSPDYETPSDVVGNIALIGPSVPIGVALAIWGIRRRRR